MSTTGIYWGLSALALLGALDQVDRSQAIQEVHACYHPESGMLSL
jgi:prenyltransferase beta subunit